MKGACEKVAESGVVGTPGLLQGLLGVPLPVVVAGRTPVVEEEEVVEEGVVVALEEEEVVEEDLKVVLKNLNLQNML